MPKKKSVSKKRKTAKKTETKLFINKSFWIVFVSILVISFLTIALETNNSLTGHATQKISFLKENSFIQFGMRDVIGGKTATIYFNKDLKDEVITINKDDTIQFDGLAYSKFTVTGANPEKIKTIEFKFELSEQDLSNKGLFVKEVALYHNTLKLDWTLDKEENKVFFYSATAPEGGAFVIGKMNEPKVEVTLTPKEEPKVEPKEEPTPAPVQEQPKEEGFWEKIANFFKNLF